MEVKGAVDAVLPINMLNDPIATDQIGLKKLWNLMFLTQWEELFRIVVIRGVELLPIVRVVCLEGRGDRCVGQQLPVVLLVGLLVGWRCGH